MCVHVVGNKGALSDSICTSDSCSKMPTACTDKQPQVAAICVFMINANLIWFGVPKTVCKPDLCVCVLFLFLFLFWGGNYFVHMCRVGKLLPPASTILIIAPSYIVYNISSKRKNNVFFLLKLPAFLSGVLDKCFTTLLLI